MIGERLEELFNGLMQKGIIQSKKDFAELIGVDYGSLSKYFSNKVNLSINDLNYLNYKKANINLNWLLTGEGDMFEESKAVAPVIERIPLLRQSVSCGPGVAWESSDNIEGFLEPLSLIGGNVSKDVYAFRARGISMEGVGIQDGDIVFFDGSKDQVMNDGVFVFGFAGDAYCKLLRFEPLENKIRIYSVQKRDIAEAELIRTIEADSPEFRIFGRVLAWLHENKVRMV